MKKFKIVGFLIVLALLASSPAFALQCKTGNYGSDECWTTGQHVTSDRGAVLAGSVMVYDFVTPTQAGNDENNAAFNVRLAGATRDLNIVAGVAQKNYASGDRIQLLVRGKGLLRVPSTNVVSGDALVTQVQSGTGNWGEAVRANPTEANSRDRAIAFSLENSTSASTIDAYIIVI